jgi:hypothetical protein
VSGCCCGDEGEQIIVGPNKKDEIIGLEAFTLLGRPWMTMMMIIHGFGLRFRGGGGVSQQGGGGRGKN